MAGPPRRSCRAASTLRGGSRASSIRRRSGARLSRIRLSCSWNGSQKARMIEEHRRLTFSMDELATAVLSYLIASKKMGERDKLGKLTVGEGAEVRVAVTVVAPGGEQSLVDLAAQ